MRYAKLLGLTLAAVFAFGAVAVALASAALPEFEGPFPNGFTATQLGGGRIETVAGRTIECSGGSATGTVKSAKDVLVKGVLTGCQSTSFGAGKCQNTSKEGEIVSLAGLGLLGYIAKPKVGILIETENGEQTATAHCNTLLGTETLTLKGTGICELTPINVKTKNAIITCRQTRGIQSPSGFEGAAEDAAFAKGEGPENFAFERAAVSGVGDVVTEKETQIKA